MRNYQTQLPGTNLCQPKLLLDRCRLSNACSAVNLTQGSKAEIKGNTFAGNYRCLNVTNTPFVGGVVITGNTFDATSGVVTPCAGQSVSTAINLTNVAYILIGSQNSLTPPNQISGYTEGLTGSNSNFDLYTTKFSSGGLAIDIDGYGGVFTANIHGFGGEETSLALIDRHGLGISTKNYNLILDNARIESTTTEVEAFQSNIPAAFIVTNCRFESFGINAINLVNSVFAGVHIEDSEFRDNIGFPDYRYGTRFNFSQMALPNKAFVKNNQFFDDFKVHDPNPLHQHVGTYLNHTQRIRLEGNTYFQNYATTAEHEYKGILLFNASYNELVGNDFFAVHGSASSNNYYQYRGIDNTSSSNCLISCNYAEKFNSGFFFAGAGCNMTNFRLNQMEGNNDDLYLTAGTMIGEQKDQENKWPSSSPTEARFEGDPNQTLLASSRFLINTSNQNSPLWATPRIPADNWFDDSGNAPTLSLPCYKIADPNDPEQARSSRILIGGDFVPYKGYPATTWDASLFAYSELLAHPQLRPNGGLDAQFFNTHDVDNVGKLQRAKEAWENIGLFSTTLESDWSNNQTATSQKLGAIREQQQLFQVAATPTQKASAEANLATLHGGLNVLQQENEALSSQYLATVNTRANQLLTDLGAISTSDTWETNLKTVLTLLSTRHIANSSEWTPTDYATLKSIADQCRHEGGIGVILARSAIEKFAYDDEALCPGLAYERSSTSNYVAAIAPNPSNDRANIQFNMPVSGTLTVTDVTGKALRSIRLENTVTMDIDTGSLANGLYFVSVTSDKMPVWSGKLTISH